MNSVSRPSSRAGDAVKRDNTGKDSSSPTQWLRMPLVVALKTDVIARYRRRSDAEYSAFVMRVDAE